MTQTERPSTMSAEEAARQKQIEDWLPVTGARKAKWWYSAFHNLTAMVGAGVLSLPFAMSRMGWYVRKFLLCFHLSPSLVQCVC